MQVYIFLCSTAVLNGNYVSAYEAKENLSDGFNASYLYGALSGISIAAVIIVICACKILFAKFFMWIVFGISFDAFLGRTGGGMYTKACDVGSDLLGKIQYNFDEDSIKNPLFASDSVGDNFGDAINAGRDILETIALALLFIPLNSASFFVLICTTIASAFCVLSVSLISMWEHPMNIFSRKINDARDIYTRIMHILFYSLIVISILLVILRLLVPGIVISAYIAAVCAIAIVLMCTFYFTSDRYTPTQSSFELISLGGTPMSIIKSIGNGQIAVGCVFTALAAPIAYALYYETHQLLCLIPAIIAGYTPVLMSIDSYGPIVDNAGCIAVSGQMEEVARDRTDILDCVGNMTKALTKSYTALLLGITGIICISNISEHIINRSSIYLIIGASKTKFVSMLTAGLLVGSAAVFTFSGIIMDSVSKLATWTMDQGREILGKRRNLSDDELIEQASLVPASVMYKSMVYTLLILIPLYTEFMPIFFFRKEIAASYGYLLGIIMGSLSTGSSLSIFMTICGGSMDNVSKMADRVCTPKIKELKRRVLDGIQNCNIILAKKEDPQAKLSVDRIDNSISVRYSSINYAQNNKTFSQLIEDSVELKKLENMKKQASETDVVGDPMKDSAGNTITSMVKCTIIIALNCMSMLQ